MSGLGNDFIAIDNRAKEIPEGQYENLSKTLCRRRVSVGADGILMLESHPKYDFRMRYINPDGTETMCGNGARCLVRFAHLRGAIGQQTRFKAEDGPHRAWVREQNVRLELLPPRDIRLNMCVDLKELGQWDLHFANTGVPHLVTFVEDLQAVDVFQIGRALRYHEAFSPHGTNVNFACLNGNEFSMRTYERGVEEETLACGTGATACAIVACLLSRKDPPTLVRTTSGGILEVDFTRENARVTEVFLTGEAIEVYQGKVIY